MGACHSEALGAGESLVQSLCFRTWECVLGSLHWVGYLHWPVWFFLFQKGFKDIYIKFCDRFIQMGERRYISFVLLS